VCVCVCVCVCVWLECELGGIVSGYTCVPSRVRTQEGACAVSAVAVRKFVPVIIDHNSGKHCTRSVFADAAPHPAGRSAMGRTCMGYWRRAIVESATCAGCGSAVQPNFHRSLLQR
jgi:hypothetical protein